MFVILILMKRKIFLLFLFILTILFFTEKILADHTCQTSCGYPPRCVGALKCIDGLCRNEFCPSDSDCICSNPNNLRVLCSSSGNSVTLSWTQEGGAQMFAIRINNTTNPWNGNCNNPNPGDVCQLISCNSDGVTCTWNDRNLNLSYNISISRNTVYEWWIHAIESGRWTDAVHGPSFICPPPQPTNLRASCSQSSNLVTLSWDQVPGAQAYALRVNNTNNPWQGNCSVSQYEGDICNDNVTTNSYTFNPLGGANYDWWLHSITSGGWSQAVHGPSFRCQTPTPTPTLTPTPTSTPTPYPTAVILGNLREYLGNSCYNNIYTSSLQINLNPQSPNGIITNCGITPPNEITRSSYRCTIVFNNQNTNPTPIQNFSLSARAFNYSAGYWTIDNACNEISNNNLLIDVASGRSTVYNKDIFFPINSPWIKLKDSSFSSLGELSNVIPLNISPYDIEDTNNRYLIINSNNNDPGVVTASSINISNNDISNKRWYVENYRKIKSFSPQVFLNYVKSRKNIQNIRSLSNIQQKGVYFWENDFQLDNNLLNQTNVQSFVLITNGNVIIREENFNIGRNCVDISNSKSIAIISTQTISFYNNSQCAAGIFIAENINIGSNNNQGLKIKGNLIALNSLSGQRRWENNNRPSLFMFFQPKIYLDLLPYLSISKYDWEQLQ